MFGYEVLKEIKIIKIYESYFSRKKIFFIDTK